MNLKINQREGYVILHPDGYIELTYFFNKKWKTKLDGYKEDIGVDSWMKTYRPHCKITRMKLVDV